jgi:hypothetical protein
LSQYTRRQPRGSTSKSSSIFDDFLAGNGPILNPCYVIFTHDKIKYRATVNVDIVKKGGDPPKVETYTTVRLPNGFLYTRPDALKMLKTPQEVGVRLKRKLSSSSPRPAQGHHCFLSFHGSHWLRRAPFLLFPFFLSRGLPSPFPHKLSSQVFRVSHFHFAVSPVGSWSHIHRSNNWSFETRGCNEHSPHHG